VSALIESESRFDFIHNYGNQLILTPPFSASVWTAYQLPIRLTVGGGLRWQDAVFVNPAVLRRSL